ncbi:MAG TPA: FAD-dependent monooxygenase, partial [Acidimicrobiales bacterium]|nr:FAD-dependent monooxygenase [Acidimicrobiales bacterium]
MTDAPLPDPHPLETPVLIVGAGPVGLTAARLLANAGRRCVVVERRDGPQRNPAAHVVNARTLEILRQAGFDMDAIDAIAKDPADAGHVNFMTRLDGELIGRLPFERQGDDCLAHTPTPLRNISQHRLEPLLAEQVAPRVELHYGVEWVSATQDADGVTSVLRDLATGEERTVRSAYLLGADGAGSPVRKWLGIPMLGPASIQSFVAIHVEANLRPYVSDRLGVLHFVLDPEAQGTFIAHDLDREWVFMVAYDPEVESVEDYDAARAASLVNQAVGASEAPVDETDVVGAGTWHMSAQVAEHLGRGRVFLIG